MLTWFLSAWLLGLAGSAHCIGMCGPLGLSLPVQSQQWSSRWVSALLYNIGRIGTYIVYGSLIGFAQWAILPFVHSYSISIVLGSILIILGIIFLLRGRYSAMEFKWPFSQKVIQTMGKLYAQSSNRNVLFIGILNGLLPCGLVYAALAAAFASGSVWRSMVFMAGFGFGTLPAMWSLVFFAQFITADLRRGFRKLYPFVYILTGIFLIWRGSHHHDPVQQIQKNPQSVCQ